MLLVHPWDAVLMPINVCDYFYRSFTHQVVPKANERGVGVLGMKSLGGGSGQRGRFVTEKVCTAEEARRYALSQQITSLICGIDSMEILKQDVAIARSFKPMTPDEQQQLLAKVKPVATDGRHERFKSTQTFDSDHHRKQHGFA
jgi:predicted aldo/keto reductase-like oxidoreductase